MGINVLIGVFFIRNLFEIVYIQLTYKGGEVRMLEVFGKYFLRKSGMIVNLKGALFAFPSDKLGGLILQLKKLLHSASVLRSTES